MMQLISDIFPAEVVLPDATVVTRGRVFVTDEGVIVLREIDTGRAAVAFRDRHSDEPELPYRGAPRNKQRTKVHTAQGDVLVRRVGCACGSPLIHYTLDSVLRGEIT